MKKIPGADTGQSPGHAHGFKVRSRAAGPPLCPKRDAHSSHTRAGERSGRKTFTF